MDRVKSLPQEERHVALLVGLLQQRLRDSAPATLPVHEVGLRLSHLRVLDLVPAEGIDVTGLASRVGMTVQGAGQFVTALVDTGLVETRPDPGDGRRKQVHRTPAGQDLVLRSARVVQQVEGRWAEHVGSERYAVFRAVLEELTLDAPPPPARPEPTGQR